MKCHLRIPTNLTYLFSVFLPLSLVGGGIGLLGDPEFLSKAIDDRKVRKGEVSWIRVRGVAGSGAEGDTISRSQDSDLRDFTKIRANDSRICALLRWPYRQWPRGTREGIGNRLPVDLRDAFEQCRVIGGAYHGFVDAWEVENEPDIGFVQDNPEVFGAFFKVCSLGLRAGAFGASRIASNAHTPVLPIGVIMPGGLGLPPGPYLERLIANGVLDYSTGFAYHYYGYSGDFAGVHAQFMSALESKVLPTFVTEYGYGLLTEAAAKTLEGRSRQLAWFRAVGSQMGDSSIAAMAYCFEPYLEGRLNEFGLLSPRPLFGFDDQRPENPTKGAYSERRIGGYYSTPALEYLLSNAVDSRSPLVRYENPASPIVLDFIGIEGMTQIKSYHGYLLTGELTGSHRGHGNLLVYNFSDYPVTGRILMGSDLPGAHVSASLPPEVTISSMGRHEFPIEIRITDGGFREARVKVTFVARDATTRKWPDSKYVFSVFRNAIKMKPLDTITFDFLAHDTLENAAILVSRKVEREEPRLESCGRWLRTPGLEVVDDADLWKFHLSRYPSEPLRPAIAELPLPSDTIFTLDEMVHFQYRAVADASNADTNLPLSVVDNRTGDYGNLFDAYVRMANGNLFGIGHRLRPTFQWQTQSAMVQHLSMGFWGRANNPNLSLDNRPISIVFFFKAATLPAAFEVKKFSIVRWYAP